MLSNICGRLSFQLETNLLDLKFKTKSSNLKSFFSTSSEWIAAIRRLANDLTSAKSVCIVIWGFSCGVTLVGLFTHIIQIFNDGVWLGGTMIFVEIIWSCTKIAGDDGVNSMIQSIVK